MLTAFVLWELSVPDPLVHFRLFTDRTFATGILVVTVLGFVLYGSLVLLPLFMQTLLGWTSVTAGVWTSPRGLGPALCMPVVGYLLGKGWDGRKMLTFGFLTTSLAFFGYSHMNLNSGTWDILWYQVNQGMGMSFVFVPLTTLTMDPVPAAETGFATGLYSLMRNIGSSMGISFVTTWVARQSQVHQTVLAAHVTSMTQATRLTLARAQQAFQAGGSIPITASRQALAAIYGTVQQQAALLSYLEAFRLMGILFLAVIPLVWLMRRAQGRRGTVAAR